MARKSELEKQIGEGVKFALANATPGFEVAFLVGWLSNGFPAVAADLQKINPTGDNVLERIAEMRGEK